jgi:hypothetical protein
MFNEIKKMILSPISLFAMIACPVATQAYSGEMQEQVVNQEASALAVAEEETDLVSTQESSSEMVIMEGGEAASTVLVGDDSQPTDSDTEEEVTVEVETEGEEDADSDQDAQPDSPDFE